MEQEQELDRVDAVIKARFPGIPRKYLEEAVESGLVIGRNGNRIKKGDRLDPEEVDCRRLSEQLEMLARGDKTLTLKTITQGPDFAVVDKPAGVLSEPHSLFDFKTVTHWALARYPEVRREFPELQPALAPLPLEADVSGLLLVAKTRAGFTLWSDRFARGEVTLSYLAWCWGQPKQHRLFISSSLSQSRSEPGKWVEVPADQVCEPPAQSAVTVVQVADVFKRPEGRGLFLAEIQTATHVPHQVRVHMASKTFPLVGDSLYDTAYEGRLEKPAHLQLMVATMEHEGHRVQAPSEAFKQRYQAP